MAVHPAAPAAAAVPAVPVQDTFRFEYRAARRRNGQRSAAITPCSVPRCCPADRVSALAGRTSPGGAGHDPCRAPSWPSRSRSRSIGKAGLNYGHLIIDARPKSRATVVIDHRARPRSPPTSRCCGRRGEPDPDQRAGLGRRSGPVAAHAALLGRDASFRHIAVNLGGELVRLNPTVASPARGRGRAVRAVLRRRRPAPGGPALRRPRGAGLHVRRALQDGAGRRRRAHGLDR